MCRLQVRYRSTFSTEHSSKKGGRRASTRDMLAPSTAKTKPVRILMGSMVWKTSAV